MASGWGAGAAARSTAPATGSGATRGAPSMSCSPASGDGFGGSPSITANRRQSASGSGGRPRFLQRRFDNRPFRREGDGRRGADADRALQFDPALMQLHDPLDRRETETGALVTPAQGAVHLHERFEHPAQIMGRDADPAIGHGDRQAALIVEPPGNLDPPAGRGELYGIADEVEKNLARLALIAAQPRQIGGKIDRDADPRLVDRRTAD